jgi:hypothetical protein
MFKRKFAAMLGILCTLTVPGCSSNDALGDNSAAVESLAESTTAEPADATQPGSPTESTAAEESYEVENLGTNSTTAFDFAQVQDLIQKFWIARAPGAGVREFVAIPNDRFFAVGEDPPVCDGEAIDRKVIVGNAVAFRCPEGSAVGWDPEVFADLEEKFGPSGPAIVLAHEFGHV